MPNLEDAVELYHLRTFVTVAEEGHLTRAAERLFTSQPAISAHIKALEEELGLTLFQRTPRGMQLTPAGAQLLERARQALAAAQGFLHEARGMKGELIGTARIGLNTDAEFLRLPELQARLVAAHPRLEIEYHSGRTGANLPALRVGRLDVAFVSGDCDDSLLDSCYLRDEELAVAVPASLLGRTGAGDIAALAALPWVYTSPECSYYRSIRALFQVHGCEPAKAVMAEQEDVMWAMIRLGQGLGIVRREHIERPENRGFLHALPLEVPPLPLHFAWLRRRANDPLVRALREMVSDIWGVGHPVECRADAG
jgi:DNA-binding transcriptional LysR family regulator